MTDSALVTVFMGLTTISLLILTITVARAASTLRVTLQRVQELLPSCQATVQETRHAVEDAREILARANRASRSVEDLATQVHAAAGAMATRLHRWQSDAHSWWGGQRGNGTDRRPGRRSHS